MSPLDKFIIFNKTRPIDYNNVRKIFSGRALDYLYEPIPVVVGRTILGEDATYIWHGNFNTLFGAWFIYGTIINALERSKSDGQKEDMQRNGTANLVLQIAHDTLIMKQSHKKLHYLLMSSFAQLKTFQ